MSKTLENMMPTDILDHVLNMLRLQASNIYNLRLQPPWGIKLSTPQQSAFHVVERGDCWLLLPDQDPIHLTMGDLITVTNYTKYALVDHPTSTPVDLPELLKQYHNQPPQNPPTALVCSSFQTEHAGISPLLALLPPLIHLHDETGEALGWLQTSLYFIFEELKTSKPGHQAIISRLMDVIIIMVIRHWIETYPSEEGGWLGALYHPQLGPALHLIHTQPDHRWTVDSLAKSVNLSRSHLAALFTEIIGESTIRYLTRWRMQLAVMLLIEHPELDLQEVAHRVGYQSAYTFSKAFKRTIGIAPSAYRRHA